MWIYKCENPRGVFVVVHGAAEHHGRYDWLVKRLNEGGFHVVLGDLPGQGKTVGRRGHIESFDEYIKTITSWYKRAEQFGLPIFILGHSMGGLSVIQTLLKKQLQPQAVILSSPCLGLVKPASKSVQMLANLLDKVAPKFRFPTNLEKGSETRCEVMRKRDESDPLIVKKVSVRWYKELNLAMKTSHERTEEFPDIPLLVLQAGEDLIVKKEDVLIWFNKLRIKDKTYKEWPGLYHEVFNEPEKENVFLVTKSFIDLHL